MTDKKKYTATIKEGDNDALQIEVSIPWEYVAPHKESTIKEHQTTMKIDGFRQGHVPPHIVEKNIDSLHILEDMAEKSIKEIYPDIIMDNELDVIGHPKISITKLAEGNPLEFTAHVHKIPTVELPDYKTLAKEANKNHKEVVVEDKEIEDAISHIQKEWAKKEKLEARAKIEGKEIKEIDPSTIEIKDEDLPKMDDEFAQKIGPFKNEKDFREKLTENILNEKTQRAKEKNRAEILEKIREGTKVHVPDMLVDAELNRMMAQFQSDVERLGMKFEDYIKHSGKSIEELRSTWQPDALKYAKNQMILNKIALEENLTPDEKERDAQVDALLKMHKNAEKERVQIYVDTVMTNDLVLEFLEGQK